MKTKASKTKTIELPYQKSKDFIILESYPEWIKKKFEKGMRMNNINSIIAGEEWKVFISSSQGFHQQQQPNIDIDENNLLSFRNESSYFTNRNPSIGVYCKKN